MSKQCEICGKKPMRGNNVSHSQRKTKTIWEPNLQVLHLDGKKTKLCTSCLRTSMKKVAA